VRDEGLIGAIGLSNVTLEQYQAARKVTEIACVQNGYNLADRSDQRLFDSCAAAPHRAHQLGVAGQHVDRVHTVRRVEVERYPRPAARSHTTEKSGSSRYSPLV
jgi:Aldo/keto reductase family